MPDLNIEIDGKQTQVAPGTTVIEAANALGIYVPHFCYHKKLSIAANCRMCLVQVEKAPKPLPALQKRGHNRSAVWHRHRRFLDHSPFSRRIQDFVWPPAQPRLRSW